MPINLANVKISLDQFQSIASGKYNAGEVSLTSETTLGKINNHVHKISANTKSLSHEEVLAIKNALVKALSEHGVGQEEINRIRREIGLGADTGIDKTLHERSLKPLTRQQVRQILDRNAATINAFKGENGDRVYISTSTMLYGGEGMDAERAERRDEVNAALTGSRETQAHQGLATAEAIIAGDVDFRSEEENRVTLAHVRAMHKRLLEETNGNPSAEREAVVKFRMKNSGQEMSISTGMSELAFIRKLEGIIIRLSEGKNADARSVNVRTTFSALTTPEARRDWLNSLAGTPDAGFKVRTAFIQMLMEAGIDDWETLNLINRINDEDALAAAQSLAALNGQVRGDALRHDHLLVALSHLAENAVDVSENSRAVVPATSPYQWNKTIKDALCIGAMEKLPHEFKMLLDTVPGHLREMFGPEIIEKNVEATSFLDANAVNAILPDLNAAPVTAEGLRASLMTTVERSAAERCARRHLEKALMAAGVGEGFSAILLTAWSTSRPQLKERLLASRSVAETANILAEVREEVEGDVKRLVTAERCCNKVTALYKETLARELGVPSSCFAGDKPDMTIISRKASDMISAILRGEIAAPTEADIEAVFRKYALDTAKKRADVIRAVDNMGLPDALRDSIKTKLFKITRVDKLDVPKTLEAARKEFGAKIEALYAALKPNASKEAVYAAMHEITGPLGDVIQSLLPEGAEMGVEETDAQGDIIMSFIIYSKEGMLEKLDNFFNRADVKADKYYDPTSPAYVSAPLIVKLNERLTNADIVSTLGKPQMPPFHAQALMQAFEDAGLGAKSITEKMAILRPTHPAGQMLSSAIRAQSEGISPSKLREIAVPILMAYGNAPAARNQEETERMNALLTKYDGGLSEAERIRLREFAEELDFSEEAAPASEKVLAERLDEICGGGGFNNPASSASRRALASGFKLADLPALARMVEILDGNVDDPIEAILDPQSEFRRNWDASLLRYAGNTPANLPKIPANVKIAITKALVACEHEADLIAIVSNGINRVVRNGANVLRNEDDIKEVVERVRANLQELREATADNPTLFAAGKEMLFGLEARRVPDGFIKHLIDTVKQIQITAVQKLRARSSAKEIHAALMQIYGNISTILLSGNSEGLFEGDDEVAPCRTFLIKAMVSRLDQRTIGRIRDALASENSSKLIEFYSMIEKGEIEIETLPEGVKGNVEGISAKLANYADHLNEVVHQALGEENVIIPIFNGVFDINTSDEIKAPDILGDIKILARTECEKACDNFLKKNFHGNSPASNALRNLYSTKLAHTKPFSPDDELSKDYSFATKHFLNLNIVRNMKYLETTGLHLSQFALDRNRGFDVFLPNGQLLSTDPATAADELARFVTGREDATYATLGKAEKTKVHFVMSILTQEANTATITGAGFALDQQGKNQMFEYGGIGQGLSRSFHLSKISVHGDISIDFETTLRPSTLIVNNDLIPFQGNEIEGSFKLILSPELLDNISNLDFTQCDNTASDEIYNRQPPVENKLRASVEALPHPFRLNISPKTSFAFNLNQ